MTTSKKIKTVICGSTFGQFYLEAITLLKDQFELVGLVGQGSERTKKCATHYNVPIYTSVEELPEDIDLACVVLRSSIMGGKGSEFTVQLLQRGIHVIQEHPMHHDDIAKCLKVAQQNKVNYLTGDLYTDLPAVQRFIACCKALFKEQQAEFIDISTITQVSFPLLHILLEGLPTLRPFKIDPKVENEGPFQLLTGTIGKIPFTLRAHHEVNPEDPDNHYHLLHNITVGFPGGSLVLSDTHGPVIWRPRLHVPHSGLLVNIGKEEGAHLGNPSSVILGPAQPPKYTDILLKQWVRAVSKDFLLMKDLIEGKERKEKRAQKELLYARQWHELTKVLGYPKLKSSGEFTPVDIQLLYDAANSIALNPEEIVEDRKETLLTPNISLS